MHVCAFLTEMGLGTIRLDTVHNGVAGGEMSFLNYYQVSSSRG